MRQTNRRTLSRTLTLFALTFACLASAAREASAQSASARGVTLNRRAHAAAQMSQRARPSSRAGAQWWKHAVFYEIYPRSFKDSDGDGVGDLNGITSKLDHLARLGIDAIWITPFYPSPQVDFGYDVSDYEAVDPQFGTLADFDRLVHEAHRRRIKVVIDFVLNHTSDQHPFFKESRSSKTNPKRDWYIWRDAKPDGGPPNNWSSSFGPVAWSLDPQSGQYFYHYFYEQQPDLNWRNPAVERRMFETVRFWLRRGADGFRLDAVNYLFEDPQLRDNPVLPELRPGTTTGEHLQEKKFNRDLDDVHPVMRRLRAFTDRINPESVLIGEAYVLKWDVLMKYYGAHDDELQLPFNFFLVMDKVRTNLDAAAFRSVINDSESALAGRSTTYVLSNHDIPRAYDRLGDSAHHEEIARLLATMLLTLRCSPFLYYGEEIGMQTSEPRTIDEVRDPVGKRYWPANKGRDGERTPMQWDAGTNAGFTTGTPWLPVPASASAHNVAAEERDPESLLNFYRRLINFRRSSPSLLDGDYASVGDDPHVFAYSRRALTQTALVALNMSNEPQTLRNVSPKFRAALSSIPNRKIQLVGTELRLAPFEAVILVAPAEAGALGTFAHARPSR